MATWGRGIKDWDPMRDDYNDSLYDTQYPDENTDSGVQLDHRKLYVTNIPQTLSENGLKLAFSKYGKVIKIHTSRDPKKHYALIFYESPSEAKLALMKLNKSEPLKLNIAVAHKKSNNQPVRVRSSHPSVSQSNNYREEDSSVSSKEVYQNTDAYIEVNNMQDNLDEESLFGVMNPELDIEFTKLQLRELEVQRQEIQFQKKLLLLSSGKKEVNANANRTVTADGKITFKNTNERPDTGDTTLSGAGDALKLPGLQRDNECLCLACGRHGELFCAGCGVAPYCSPKCQTLDWSKRHRTVCHNLVRTPDQGEPTNYSTSKEVACKYRSPKQKGIQNQDDEDSSGNTKLYKNEQLFERKPQTSTRTSIPIKGPLRRPKIMDSKHLETFETESKSHTNVAEINAAPVVDRRPNVEPLKEHCKSNKKYADVVDVNNINPLPHYYTSPLVQSAIKTQMSTMLYRGSVMPTGNAQKSMDPSKVAPAEPTTPVVIPKIEILPKMYIVATFEVGDTFLLSVAADARECLSKQKGLVCIALNNSCEDTYSVLCDDYCVACNIETETYTPKPGELFSFNNREDEDSWFRARCLNSTSAALIDTCQIASIAAGICKRIPVKYQDIPEFCCVLDADVAIGSQVTATIVTKLSCESVLVDLNDATTNDKLGHATVSRWSPVIEIPIQTANPILRVPRPHLKNNSRVIVVGATKLDAVYVRPADGDSARQFNDIIQDAILCAQKSTPLKHPPARGQVVIAKYKNGIFSRALVQRINTTRTKFMLEYIEFGDVEPQTLDTLYQCPDNLNLDNQPTLVSCVKVRTEYPDISEPAKEYITKVKDKELELILTIDEPLAPSGSEARLALEKNKENFNRTVVEMCKPGWKLMEQKGTDVVELPPIMYYDIEYASVPLKGCEFTVLDIGTLLDGVLSGYPSDTPRASFVLNHLPDLMAAYCNSDLGREPYLPLTGEVCIAKLPPHDEWFRAVMVEQVNGAGGSEAKVSYLDYGNIADVPVSVLRKMVPEFVKDIPGLASTVKIRDFPSAPTEKMVEQVLEHLQLDDLDRGRLQITNCTKIGKNTYEADAPGLLAAMKAN